MSDLYTVAEQLEQLNSAQAEQNEGIDAVHRAIQSLREANNKEGNKNSSMLLGSLSDLKSAAVSVLSTGFEKMRQASAKLETLQIQSLTTGVDMKGVIDKLAEQNNAASEAIKKGAEDTNFNFAGLLEAARAQADAAKVGLDLSISDKDTSKDSNHELRNVVGLLDKQGQQGQTVLLHFQDLIRRGYTEDQARTSVESFAKIAMNSLQTADNTKKLLDQFTEIETLQVLLGGGLGEELQVAAQSIAPDVADLEVLGKSLAATFMPTTKQDILISQNMGIFRDEFIEQFQGLAKELATLQPEEREDSPELKKLREISQEYFKRRTEMAIRLTGAEGVLGGGGLDMELPGLMKQSSQMSEMFQVGMRDFAAFRTLDQQDMVSMRKEIISRDGDVQSIVQELKGTLTFEIDRFNDILMGNSEAMRSFRDISTALLSTANTVTRDLLQAVDPQGVADFAKRGVAEGMDMLAGIVGPDSPVDSALANFAKALNESATKLRESLVPPGTTPTATGSHKPPT